MEVRKGIVRNGAVKSRRRGSRLPAKTAVLLPRRAEESGKERQVWLRVFPMKEHKGVVLSAL